MNLLYLDDFNLESGVFSYSIEDSNGDRVDKVIYTGDAFRKYNLDRIDFMLLSYLPKAIKTGVALKVMGPISENLYKKSVRIQDIIVKKDPRLYRITIFSTGLIEEDKYQYSDDDIIEIYSGYDVLHPLKVLDSLINYYNIGE